MSIKKSQAALTGLDHAVARAMLERDDWGGAAVIARDINKNRETVQYRLSRVLAAGFAKKRRVEPTGRTLVWRLTEAGTKFARSKPPEPVNHKAEHAITRYDHRALSAALGVPSSVSFVTTGVSVHHCMGAS